MTPQQRTQILNERAHRRGLEVVLLQPGRWALARQAGDAGVEIIQTRSDPAMLQIDMARFTEALKSAEAEIRRAKGGA
ncbi:MAG: hypothetical protein R3E78_16115 [Burkholderiaceae bacterium]